MPNLDLVLFDHEEWKQLFPLTLSRPISELRIGISTIADKWSRLLDKPIHYHTADYLSQKYKQSSSQEVLLINGAALPSAELVAQIGNLSSGQAIMSGETVIATITNNYRTDLAIGELLQVADILQFNEAEIVQWPEDLLELNDVWINRDFEALEHIDHDVDLSNTVMIGPSKKISIGSNTTVHAYSMNTTDGPIHIGSNVFIMEGAMLRGPLSIGDGTVVKMGAKLYGNTTIGPNCKVGGEIKRIVMYANSNKGHEGYLGDSVIGEWCNFGADSNNSNMKNTYGLVSLFDISSQQKRRTSQQFLGLIMGDHCRCAINTQFNTGTVASYFANIFGPPPATYIRPFQWGQEKVFDIEKAINIVRIVYKRRHIECSDVDESIIRHLYNQFRK